MLTHEELKAKALSDPEVKKHYDNPEIDVFILDLRIKAIEMRKAAKLTQAEVAERMHTTQQTVARLESPTSNRMPSISTYMKYAAAVGCKLDIFPVH